ncbi:MULTISPECIES: hypothetical protein [unclassified Spirosoma]|uniref:hypothetical protein n=1 Tax=unclassified Spirosoma TaxID=2621999 RepID=UPI000967654C|nr:MULTISPECIES: hypothetical protein [unclassified Spirosoma]MBN8822141.1 hypothetical protein [Spirosoma sp.]OJW80538.1 MAG: hypothetical protein BGO59_34235 [Spirosoma sp. 48-14]
MRSLTIHIPNPCHERWEEMQPTEQGRFCASCQKTVIDYSALSDQELVKLLRNASGQICGRLRDDQLNRALSLTSSSQPFSWRRWVGVLATALLSWKTSLAQFNSLGRPVSSRPEIAVAPIPIRAIGAKTEWTVSGRVLQLDSTGQASPAVGAYVWVSGLTKGASTQTDSSGRYSVIVSGLTENSKLTISVNTPNRNRAMTTLEITPSILSVVVDDIIVTNDRLTCISITAGGMQLIRSASRWQKIKRKLFH